MIRIIAVGRIKEKAQTALIHEYLKRLKSLHKLEVIELPKSKYQDKEVIKILQDESKRILDKVKPDDYVILLDLKGKNIDSVKLSNLIDKNVNTNKRLIFIIGGSHGVSDEIKLRSNFMWQLSALTFPHQLVRLMLVEQIYRAFSIINKHPYHK